MTSSPTVLRVGSALPDPPFELLDDDGPTGFDIAFTRAIADRLGRGWELVPYSGADFNGIFDALAAGNFDCIASGTTVTSERSARADFCAPYLVSGQSLAVDTKRHPDLHTIDDLAGLTVGVQRGNTSQPIAEQLVASGKAAAVQVYAYDQIEHALDDLSTGACDAVMKLAPVLTWLVRDRPHVSVVQRAISREAIAISVSRGNTELRSDIDNAQQALKADGTLERLTAQWLNP